MAKKYAMNCYTSARDEKKKVNKIWNDRWLEEAWFGKKKNGLHRDSNTGPPASLSCIPLKYY
jgi:hypothetical protein